MVAILSVALILVIAESNLVSVHFISDQAESVSGFFGVYYYYLFTFYQQTLIAQVNHLKFLYEIVFPVAKKGIKRVMKDNSIV